MRGTTNWLLSLRGRITIAVTLLFALVMGFGTWFLLDRAETAWIDDLRAQDLSELEMVAADLAAIQSFGTMVPADSLFLPVGEGGTTFQLTDALGQVIGATPQGIFAGAVVIESGPVSFSGFPPTFVGESVVPEAFLNGTGGPFDLELLGEVTTVSVPVDLEDGTLTLTAWSPLEPVTAGVSALRGILLLVVPMLVTGVGAMTWFVTGRTFRPVEDIANQVERITDDRLDERVPVPDSRDEVAHLATTMNSMLDRLAASRTRQREFVSDASHELRNPVATSKTQLEVALAHPGQADWEATARTVLEEQDRLGGLVDDLLMLARLDEGRPDSPTEIDLEDLVFEEASRPYDVEIDVTQVHAVRVCGDVQQLSRMLRNLVSNAVRYAESKVVLSLSAKEGMAVLRVDDDGPGIPPAERTRVFERFVRLEDSRARDEGGAGLGLALVGAVVATHGGTIQADESSQGGAQMEVQLPLAP